MVKWASRLQMATGTYPGDAAPHTIPLPFKPRTVEIWQVLAQGSIPVMAVTTDKMQPDTFSEQSGWLGAGVLTLGANSFTADGFAVQGVLGNGDEWFYRAFGEGCSE